MIQSTSPFWKPKSGPKAAFELQHSFRLGCCSCSAQDEAEQLREGGRGLSAQYWVIKQNTLCFFSSSPNRVRKSVHRKRNTFQRGCCNVALICCLPGVEEEMITSVIIFPELYNQSSVEYRDINHRLCILNPHLKLVLLHTHILYPVAKNVHTYSTPWLVWVFSHR